MTDINKGAQQEPVKLAVDLLVKLGVLLLILIWCFQIIRPFITIVVWALIIAVALLPLYYKLAGLLGNRKKLASFLITLILLAIILVPSFIFTESLVAGIQRLTKDLEGNTLIIPPPPEDVADWPLIGGTVHSSWTLASESLEKAVMQYSEQLRAVGSWLLNAVMGTGLGIIQLLASIIIAGIFLVFSEPGGNMVNRLFTRLVGEKGNEYAEASKVTIRNVAKGVLGVALIQSFLAGLVFLAAGVPYAGLWALIALIFCIIQVGPGLVIIPVIIYLFTVKSTVMAVIWMVLLILVMLSDNVLKPILMGKGAPVPMLVIFLGAIGGFMSMGFIGLFMGAIVLSLGYKLFLVYVEDAKVSEGTQPALEKNNE